MRTFSVLVATVLVASLGIKAQETKPDKIPVFVRSAASVDGFTDPDKHRNDSVKDILNAIKGSKTIVAAPTEGEALVLIEVLGRETKSERNGFTALNGQKQNKSYVSVRVTVGDHKVEFTGESGSKGVLTGYGDAAKKVYKQLEEWVKVNRAQILAKRSLLVSR